ncbi:VCBS domain-containing protein [Massilia sp. B-10]|nr:VCBS domain-containing protein [Massilia sp. B-10]
MRAPPCRAYGSLTINAVGAWTYTASTAHNEFVGGTTYTDIITVRSADNTATTVTINILGTNDAAVISATTVPLTETNAVLTASGTVAISDADSAATFVASKHLHRHLRQPVDQQRSVWNYTASSAHNEFMRQQHLQRHLHHHVGRRHHQHHQGQYHSKHQRRAGRRQRHQHHDRRFGRDHPDRDRRPWLSFSAAQAWTRIRNRTP